MIKSASLSKLNQMYDYVSAVDFVLATGNYNTVEQLAIV